MFCQKYSSQGQKRETAKSTQKCFLLLLTIHIMYNYQHYLGLILFTFILLLLLILIAAIFLLLFCHYYLFITIAILLVLLTFSVLFVHSYNSYCLTNARSKKLLELNGSQLRTVATYSTGHRGWSKSESEIERKEPDRTCKTLFFPIKFGC